ncbi:2-hydroxyacid dehydrogenase [Enemella sp. A6]|uniref:2-hydroxyacid dehydrogenase n=1 Tax=Enemella sp. A6 TaxID=3440152 RepID=UPI003EBC0ED3
MTVRVITVASMPPNLGEPLAERFGALPLPDPGPERDAFLAEHGDTIEVAVAHAGGGVHAELMDRLPALRVVAHFAVGYDSTDADAARERGITLTNTPDVLNDCVADMAIALTLDVLRMVSRGDRFIRAGQWEAERWFPLSRRLTGSKVGILGLGRIGEAIAHRLTAFDCEISYHSRREVAGSPYAYHPSATELAAANDVLIVMVPGGPATEGLVDADVLAALGPEGYLINVARGSVVNHDDLIEALRTRTIAGAGLDVFPDEPHVPEALLEFDNVVLTPHVGSATVETRQAMADVVLANVEAWFDRGELVTPV